MCSVEGCGAKWSVLTRGTQLCTAHYDAEVRRRHTEALREIEAIRADVVNDAIHVAYLRRLLDDERAFADRLAEDLAEALKYCDGFFVKKWDLARTLEEHAARRNSENRPCKTPTGEV